MGLGWIKDSTASSLTSAVDRAWERLGGGPPDLSFPLLFLGTWTVRSILIKAETPLGLEAVGNVQVIHWLTA